MARLFPPVPDREDVLTVTAPRNRFEKTIRQWLQAVADGFNDLLPAVEALQASVTALATSVTTASATITTLIATTFTATTATVSTILNLTGGQITFPATQVPSSNANTLDDYEEGAWTPSLLFCGAATGMTYSTQVGRYIKVGRIVTATCRIDLTAKGASTGTATISGLPFTAENAVASFNGSALAGGMATLTSPITPRVVANASVVDLFDWGAGGVVAIDDTNFTNASVVVVTLTYLGAA
jgi:hypothetical protein